MDALSVTGNENGNIADIDVERYFGESTVPGNEAGQKQFDVDNMTRETGEGETCQAAPESYHASEGSRKWSSPKKAWGNSSYADLICRAIMSSPDKRMTLQEIYAWFVDNIPYFMDKKDDPSTTGWKNSVRHTLSIRKRFIRVPNSNYGSLNYKSYWMINPNEGKRNRGRSQRSAQGSSVRHINNHSIAQTNQSRVDMMRNCLMYERLKVERARSCCPYCEDQSGRRLQVALSYQNGLGYYGYHY